MRSLRLASLGPSLLLAGAAIGFTAAVVFAAGTVVLPDQGPRPWQQDPSALPTVDDLTGSQALLVLSGEEQRTYELNQVTVEEWNEETTPDDPLKLLLAFRGDGASLVISARAITPGTPATGEAAQATVSVSGASYFGTNGECTISLEELDRVVLEPQPAVLDGVPRGVPIPTYAGIVECSGIEELRTDGRTDVYAVFRHRPSE